MSIFGRIKDAIFQRKTEAKTPAANTSRTATPQPQAGPTASRPAATTAAQTGAAAAAKPQAQPQTQPVDVEAVLEARAAQNSQKLNWRTSIVDLMKLLDLDPSLANRKELAAELGYTADTSDSASMNIWLHKQVMRKLGESGGKVPESLKQ